MTKFEFEVFQKGDVEDAMATIVASTIPHRRLRGVTVKVVVKEVATLNAEEWKLRGRFAVEDTEAKDQESSKTKGERVLEVVMMKDKRLDYGCGPIKTYGGAHDMTNEVRGGNVRTISGLLEGPREGGAFKTGVMFEIAPLEELPGDGHTRTIMVSMYTERWKHEHMFAKVKQQVHMVKRSKIGPSESGDEQSGTVDEGAMEEEIEYRNRRLDEENGIRREKEDKTDQVRRMLKTFGRKQNMILEMQDEVEMKRREIATMENFVAGELQQATHMFEAARGELSKNG